MTTPPMTTLSRSCGTSRYIDISHVSPHTRADRGDHACHLGRHLVVRLALRIVAVVVLLAGVLFFFQGVGVIPGSFMTGRSEWAVIGAALVAGAAALLWLLGTRAPGTKR